MWNVHGVLAPGTVAFSFFENLPTPAPLKFYVVTKIVRLEKMNLIFMVMLSKTIATFGDVNIHLYLTSLLIIRIDNDVPGQ